MFAGLVDQLNAFEPLMKKIAQQFRYREDFDDLLQDVAMKCFRRRNVDWMLPQPKIIERNTKRCLIDRFRRNRRSCPQHSLDEASGHFEPIKLDPGFAQVELRESLLIAISKLPTKHRTIFLHLINANYSDKDLAKLLKVSLPTVKNCRQRGCRRLAKLLKEQLIN